MNAFKSITCALLGLSGLALAQNPSVPEAKLQLLLQLKTGNPIRVGLNSTHGAGKFIYTRAGRVTEGNLKQCRLFMIETPADLVSAITSYRANELEDARKKLSSVKKKYANTLGLPQNPSAQAAYYELLCAIRLQDWAAVKSLAASYPKTAVNTDRMKLILQVASLLGDLSSPASSGAALQTKIEKLMEDKKRVRTLDIEFYGFLRFALAQSLIAQLPEADVKSDSLTGENATKAITAVDLLCESVVSQHGANREFAIAAMVEASKLLWSLKDVHNYLVEIGLNVEMTEAIWKKAPVNFREAVTLAFMAQQLSDKPLKDPDLEKIDRYYFGPAKEVLSKK